MKNFIPQFFISMKNYSIDKFMKDLVAGLIVAIIALPLSIALALASGVTPEQGLYTAIIAGLLYPFLVVVQYKYPVLLQHLPASWQVL